MTTPPRRGQIPGAWVALTGCMSGRRLLDLLECVDALQIPHADLTRVGLIWQIMHGTYPPKRAKPARRKPKANA